MGDCGKNKCRMLRLEAGLFAALLCAGVIGYIAIIVVAILQVYYAIPGVAP